MTSMTMTILAVQSSSLSYQFGGADAIVVLVVTIVSEKWEVFHENSYPAYL